MEKIVLKATDGYELDVHVFKVEKPKAVVQLVHGMEEHQERYEKFVNFLNDNGFSVVTSNMRGHGENAPTLGYFKDKGGYKLLISDQLTITNYIKQNFKGLPIYIFAHSMGTIITRVLLQENSGLYSKVVLSGYPNYQAATGMGILLTNVIKFFKGAKYKSKLVNKLSVGSFNKQIKNPKTSVDWVCANEETVKNYIADPLCGFGFTVSAFNDLFNLVKLMHQPKRYVNVNTALPLLLLCGANDPCVGGKKGSADSINTLKKAGFAYITSKTYDGMRHEILNETENALVYTDTLAFYNK